MPFCDFTVHVYTNLLLSVGEVKLDPGKNQVGQTVFNTVDIKEVLELLHHSHPLPLILEHVANSILNLRKEGAKDDDADVHCGD